MKQIGILSSGCQSIATNVTLNKLNFVPNILFFNDNHIFYSSTLAIYVLNSHTYVVERLLSFDHKTILSFSICRYDPNLMVVCCSDSSLYLCDIQNEQIVCRNQLKNAAHLLWSAHDPFNCTVVAMDSSIKLFEWNISKLIISEIAVIANNKFAIARWNSQLADEIAVGCQSNAVVLFNKASKAQKVLPAPGTANTSLSAGAGSIAIIDMQWDRLSSNYLLVSYLFFLVLWDTESGSIIHQFETQTVPITSIGWLDWTAGNFVTANNANSHLKLWNASQKAPLDTIRFNSSSNEGIHSMYFCPGKKRVLCANVNGSIGVYNLGTSQAEFQSAAGHTETIFDCSMSPTSPNTFCTASFDGTVKVWSVFDLSLNKVLYSQDEVIYSCDWSPKADMIVGSCSTGVIYVWNVETGHPLGRYFHHQQAVYCVQWNRTHPNLIASTSADAALVVFNNELPDPSDGSSSMVLPYPARRRNNNRSNGSSEDQFTDSNISFKFIHPGAVYGCAWCPAHTNVIVTGCHDGIVRVFSITHGLRFVLNGHSMRSFGMAWSPIVPGLLASGSDDKAICVWEVNLNMNQWDLSKAPAKNDSEATTVQPTNTLIGHTSNVRGICWNYEFSHLLISGSWDSTLRLWDTRKGVCLRVIRGHIADVYSIVTHPERPFTYISVSRDTTVRVWEIDQLTTLIRYKCLLKHDLSGVIHNPAIKSNSIKEGHNGNDEKPESVIEEHDELHSALPSSADLKLCGRFSALLNNSLFGTRDGAELDSYMLATNYYKMYSFFAGASDTMELWENVLSLLIHMDSLDFGSLTSLELKTIRNAKLRQINNEHEIINIARSEARKLESNSSTKSNMRKTDISKKMEEQLRSSAMIYARIGDFQKYCSLMVDVGEWPAALAMAPSVSMEYWKLLTQRYSQMLLSTASSEAAVPYLLAVGKDIDAVDFYLQRRDSSNAMIVAKMSELRIDLVPDYIVATNQPAQQRSGSPRGSPRASPRGLTRPSSFFKTSNPSISLDYSPSQSGQVMRARDRTSKEVDDSRSVVKVVCRRAAQMYISRSRPILAAAQLMSMGDVQGCVQLLFNNNEWDLAYAIASCFHSDCEDIIVSLADRMTRFGHFEMARDILRNSSKEDEVLGLLMSKYMTLDRTEAAIKHFELKPLSHWNNRRKEEMAIGSDSDAVIYSVIVHEYDDALAIAMVILKRLVRTPLELTIASKRLLFGLKHINATTLSASVRKEFLLYMLWFTAHEAVTAGMFDTAYYMMRILAGSVDADVHFLLSDRELRFQLLFFSIYAGHKEESQDLLKPLKEGETKEDSLIHDLLCDLVSAVENAPNHTEDYERKQSAPIVKYFLSNRAVEDHPEAILRIVQKLCDILTLPNVAGLLMAKKVSVKDQLFNNTVLQGSLLPTRALSEKGVTSFISNKRIQGRYVALANKNNVFALANEAVNWGRINPFSPLMDGSLL